MLSLRARQHAIELGWARRSGASSPIARRKQFRRPRAPKNGGSRVVLAEGSFLPTGIAVDAQAIYFTTWWYTKVARLAK